MRTFVAPIFGRFFSSLAAKVRSKISLIFTRWWRRGSSPSADAVFPHVEWIVLPYVFYIDWYDDGVDASGPSGFLGANFCCLPSSPVIDDSAGSRL